MCGIDCDSLNEYAERKNKIKILPAEYSSYRSKLWWKWLTLTLICISNEKKKKLFTPVKT